MRSCASLTARSRGFVPSRDGTAKVVLPAETGGADEMLVTREPSGGSQEPTSAPLVSATL